MKKVLSLMLAVFALVTLVSCGGKVYEADPASFSAEGMTITLTEAFKETSIDGYTACYDSSEAAVFVLKENFSLFETIEGMSLDKYAEFLYTANESKSPSAVTTENGFASIEYSFENTAENKTYKYLTAMFEGTDAYWSIQFTCEENVYDEYKPYFIEWAKSVTFAPAA